MACLYVGGHVHAGSGGDYSCYRPSQHAHDAGLLLVVQSGPHDDVGALAGRPVRVRIALRDAKLFALQFVP